MKKKFLSYVAVLISILAVFMSYPFIAIAYVDSYSSVDLDNGATSFDLSNIEILCEEVSKRGQSEKHFKLSDGSFIAVQYNEPVHYLGESGKWLDIDNTLYFDEAVDSSDFDGYVNTANSFETKFANTTEEALFYISEGDNKLSFTFVNDSPNTVEAVVIENATVMARGEPSVLERNEEIIACDEATAEISYGEVMDDVDFSYTVTGGGVKENIIINSKLDDYDFTFAIEAGSLELTLNESGSIIAKDGDGNTVYTIPAPFMYDADGHYSDSVHYVLSGGECGQYFLTISADEAWINGSDISFPVTVDPIVNTTSSNCTIVDSSVNSINSDVNYFGSPTSLVGKKSDGSVGRTYINWDNLPNLSDCDVVISAKLNYFYIGGENGLCPVELYEVVEDWDPSTITWNNQPYFDTSVIDYRNFGIDEYSIWVNWDITEYCNKWYETGVGYGFVLTSVDEASNGCAKFLSHNVITDLQPYISVRYRCQQGIEDDYTYLSYKNNDDGVAYINNYTGSLTYVHNLFSSKSTIMPATLSLIYNSTLAEYYFTSYNGHINTGAYSNMLLSNGWKLSAQETIVPMLTINGDGTDSVETYGYIYCDEDGTEHYFYTDSEDKSNVKYSDENGLGMLLTYNSAEKNYELITNNSIIKKFKVVTEVTGDQLINVGYIVLQTDEKGNSITYNYDDTNTRLLSITDPSYTTIHFGYTDNHLTQITAGSQTITIVYNYDESDGSIQDISSITDNYGSETYFSYDGALSRIQDKNTGYLSIIYEPANYSELSYRVSEISWASSIKAGFKTSKYHYDESYATTVHFFGNDGIDCENSESEDDLYFTYVFNSYGNTILEYTENACRNTIYNTDMYAYENSMELNDFNVNLSTYANSGTVKNNLINDINYSNDLNHTEGINLSLSNQSGCVLGNVWKCESVVDVGVEKVLFTKDLSCGSYCFSAYVKLPQDAVGGLVLTVKNSQGLSLGKSTQISSTDNHLNDNWLRLYARFDVQSEDSIYFAIESINFADTFYLNGLQLEVDNGYSLSPYNAIKDSSMESGFEYWESSCETSVSVDTSDNVKFGDSAIRIDGDKNQNIYVSQVIPINCIPKYSYILSGWAKGDSVPITESQRKFGLSAKVEYTYLENNVENIGYVNTIIPFGGDTSEWQYTSGVINMPTNKNVVKINSITVSCEYSYNENVALFDNISLLQDNSYKLTYDANNNVTSVTQNNISNYTYQYDENDNLIAVLDDSNGAFLEYEYDPDGNLTKVIDSEGVTLASYTYANGNVSSVTINDTTTTYEYTEWGALTETATTGAVDVYDSQVLSSQNEFDSNTKLITGKVNALGKGTYYGYNIDFWITSIEDANTNITRYEYQNGRLSYEYLDADKDAVFDESEASVIYSYDDYGRLSGVTTGTTGYTFTYNEGNLPESVYIVGEDLPLLTYTYDSLYTVNTGIIYANGLIVSYEYDVLGNLTTVKHNNSMVASFYYDNNFNLIKYVDHLSSAVTDYYFMDDGSLYLTSKTWLDHTINYYSVHDEANDTTDYIVSIDDAELVYTLDTDSSDYITTYVLPNLASVDSLILEHGRTKSVQLKDSTGEVLVSISYAYTCHNSENNEYTSNFISSKTYSNGISYSYLYDDVGNIISYTSGDESVTYEYNSQNKLVRENNQHANKTWVYEYDDSGNILSKSEYAYTTEETLGTVLDTVIYSYHSDTWGDLLTSYDGVTITYDSLGNPLNWTNNETLSWEGTRLRTINNCVFVYDYSGVRTGKYNQTYFINYIYDGDKIICEARNESGVKTYDYYYYDVNGSIVAWNKNGAVYYYIKNHQGDITGIMDGSGVVVATYAYDAYGNIISTSGDADILVTNPWRYRSCYFDIETGLYYMGNNYYDPSVGRYLSINTSDSSSSILSDYNFYDFDLVTYYDAPLNTISISDVFSPIAMNPTDVINDIPFVLQNGAKAIMYNVPVYAQTGSLCWAYCQVMASAYVHNVLYSEELADELAKKMAMEYHNSNDLSGYNNGGIPNNLGSTVVFDRTSVLYALKRYGPLYACYGDGKSDTKGEHAILVTGFNFMTDLVYTNNPNGFVHTQTFNDFLLHYSDKPELVYNKLVELYFFEW